jgi:hypothetical protein
MWLVTLKKLLTIIFTVQILSVPVYLLLVCLMLISSERRACWWRWLGGESVESDAWR